MKSKKGAMEMSVGTIVTIVLLMSVLILGIYLVQKVFSTGTNAVDAIDDKLKSQINNLFADEGKRIALFPNPQEGGVKIKQGKTGGFAISIKNKDAVDHVFSYSVKATGITPGCTMTIEQADALLGLGRNEEDISLRSGQQLETPRLVRFSISEAVPLCQIRYKVDVTTADGRTYTDALIDLTII